jgi:glycosyltransferase involved in cell wall biosynthesis
MNRTSLLPASIFAGYQEPNQSLDAPKSEREDYPIVVHCHLLWDGVWQRPQQFLSRLAKKHPVLFVETHVVEEGKTASYVSHPAAGAPGVTQLKIIFPRSLWHDGSYVDRERRRLVKAALLEPALRRFRRPVQWFYDPMAVTAFAGQLDERLIVYDCMDQLSQFRSAPAELLKRERHLLKLADVVFCGGKNLHGDKSRYHTNCHFYGCGVDTKHFAKARHRATTLPADIANLPRPILGYYGVVDERLDYDLLLKLAKSTPGSVVILGPVAKVEQSEIPVHRNLHWLGRRPYDTLPNYAKAFDVCLMPFAMNEATEYINPTKALEYLAAGRPVVSTPVPDVVSLFSKVVSVAPSARDFIDQCHELAGEANVRRQRAGLRLAKANTWERIVAELDGHIQQSLETIAEGEPALTPLLQSPVAI